MKRTADLGSVARGLDAMERALVDLGDYVTTVERQRIAAVLARADQRYRRDLNPITSTHDRSY